MRSWSFQKERSAAVSFPRPTESLSHHQPLISGGRECLGVGCFEAVHSEVHSSLRSVWAHLLFLEVFYVPAKLPQLKGSSQRTWVLWKRPGRWLDTACCTFVGVGWEPEKKKKKKGDSVCGFIGVRWRRVGNPTKTKAKISPTFHTFTGLLRLNELSVYLGVLRQETRAADKLRTNDRQCYFTF